MGLQGRVTMTLYGPPDLKTTNFHGIITTAPRMLELFRLISRIADSDAAALIRGDTGTGKELVARALHALSPRKDGPFQAINCATLTAEMLASELFGHVKGAYTGAISDRPGLLRMADGGTLFLDEIAEMPLQLQARLLRVIQEQRFMPLGGTSKVKVDVRFLSATHTALREAVRDKRFREDLMYRVRVVPLYLPRLAERVDDVEVLTWHFIRVFNRHGRRNITHLDDAARDALLSYAWPGNVRELRNCVEHAFVVGEGPVLQLTDLPPELRREEADVISAPTERGRIMSALERHHWRKSAAAEALGMSRSTLWRKMRELGIES
ncbi:MAG: sigma 54-interacting transcriptional regulator [Myxococcales bacterium]|nr:sigma 54-interacting transcriptional regulator [Myxococcales bacterium]